VNYLIDTHVLLWAIIDRTKLSDKVKAILENERNDIFVSAISIWEVSLKFSLGKLPLSGLSPDELPDWIIKTGFKLMSLSISESSTYHQLILTGHKDPFDRMLIWQAIRQNLILISKDRNVPQYAEIGLRIIW